MLMMGDTAQERSEVFFRADDPDSDICEELSL